MLAPELHASSAEIRSRTMEPPPLAREVPREHRDRERGGRDHRDRLAAREESAPARGMVLGLILGVAAWGFIISVCATVYTLL